MASSLEPIRYPDYTVRVKRDYIKPGNGPPPTLLPERLDLMGKEVVSAFGSRLKELRKAKGWTQKELASKAGIRFSQLNKYECGLHAPPLDKLVELAEILDTDVGFLLTGSRSDAVPIRSTRLLERFKELEQFPPDDRETVIKVIDAMIVKRRVEGALTVDAR